MSEIRKPLVEVLNAVRNGELPLDTAQQVHLVAHRHVMDRYADDREARRIGEKEQAKQLQKSVKKLKDI